MEHLSKGAVFGVVFEANHGDQRLNVENVTSITNIFGIILKRTTVLSFFSQFGSTVFSYRSVCY